MTTTTTIVATGLPPRIPNCEPALQCVHRVLPHTGGGTVAFAALSVVLVGMVTVWIGRRRTVET